MNERSVAFSAPAGNAAPTASDAAPNAGVQAVPGATAPPAANPAAPVPNPQIAAAYAAPVPVAGLAVEIVARAKEGQNRFEIRLDPPELGRIDVHLRVDRDGNVSSRLIVERTETLDLLRRDAPQLERALQNAGLKTGEQGLEFSLRDQMAGRDHHDRQESPRGNRIVVPDEEAQPVAAAMNQYGRLAGLGSGLDIRV
jgi:flagellar hook-length control protein FliK